MKKLTICFHLFLLVFVFLSGHTCAQNSGKLYITMAHRKADFGGTARINAVGLSIGSKGYIGTGYDIGNKRDFWEYDPALNTWTQKANFGGTFRTGAAGFTIGNKGYIGTGKSGTRKNDFWEYNPATDTWAQKANFSGTARDGATAFCINGKGYMGLGYDITGVIKSDFYEEYMERVDIKRKLQDTWQVQEEQKEKVKS